MKAFVIALIAGLLVGAACVLLIKYVAAWGIVVMVTFLAAALVLFIARRLAQPMVIRHHMDREDDRG